MPRSTSVRISDMARSRIAARAASDGVSATALLDQLIVEGIDQIDYPGVIFRGPAHDRRAALTDGPDVWEIVARLQELDGPDERRIAVLSEESDLDARLIRFALDYAADHAQEIRDQIERDREIAERIRETARRAAADKPPPSHSVESGSQFPG
jgi:hypothetical protein